MSSATGSKTSYEKFLTGMPPKPRSRLATVLATLFGVLALALIGACAGGMYYFRPHVDESADRVPVVQAEMLEFDPPPQFEPRGTIEWNFFSLVIMRGIYYELASGEATLMLLQVDSRLMKEADVQEHVERTLREKGGGGPPLTITSSEEKTYSVRGKLTPFRLRVGESPADRSKYRLLEGIVDGRSGKVLMAFRVDEAVWNDHVGNIELSILGTE